MSCYNIWILCSFKIVQLFVPALSYLPEFHGTRAHFGSLAVILMVVMPSHSRGK